MPPPTGSLIARTLRAVLVGVLLPVLFVAAFIIPGHNPKPNGLPVAVVGAAPAQLEERGFEVLEVADEAAARTAVEDATPTGG